MGTVKAFQFNDLGEVRKRAPRNRTLTVNESEVGHLRARLLAPDAIEGKNFVGRTILGDCFAAFGKLPPQMADLLILDPPYILNKKFGSKNFSRMPVSEYTDWLRGLFHTIKPLLKPTATVYICGEWLSSASIFTAASDFFEV